MSKKKGKKVQIFPRKKHVPEIKVIEDLRSKYDDIDETKIKKFKDLPLSSRTLKGLAENNFFDLTDIQRQSIGLALRGNDILGAAKTGSGKTLAFLIPILEILYCKQWTRLDGVGALVITPTRELAYQIYETLRKVGQHHDTSAGLIIGGKDLKFEKKRMDQCNIIICTPGRLLQHMDENPLFDCVNMQILVLDEADRCLDMGFEQTMNSIIENLPPKRQTLLFSATQTKSVRDLARLSLKDPMYVSVHEYSMHTTPEGLQQSYVVCNLDDKMSMIWSFVKNHIKQKIIVFFSSCKQVKYIYEAFCRLRPGLSVLSLYGTLHQLKRMEIYETFCRKQHAVLFATDIAARGLDFPAIDWVVQMDCPEDVNSYIHRAGRTARFQSNGEALLVLLPSEEKMVEKLRERKIPINMIKVNPDMLRCPQRKLEALLAQDVSLKESAQRAFVSYVKSVFLMKDKEIFNVRALNTDSYAKSLGLAVPPRIRFLQRMERKEKLSGKEIETKDETNVNNESFSYNANRRDNISVVNDDDSDDDEERNILPKKALEGLKYDDSDDDDILTVKRKNIDVDDIPIASDDDKDKNKKKVVTKAAVAKKVLKKKIIPNKKTTFNEEGQEVLDPTKSKLSELARKYENEEDSGINIEIAKQILKEEDRFDKQRFRERVKEKHREEKRKLKAKKKKMNMDEVNDEEMEEMEEIDEIEGDNASNDTSDSEYSEPDLSWLPDPDKIYGKEKDVDESSDNAASDEVEEESKFHRPSKRKLMTQEEYKKLKKKQKTSFTIDSADLKADEELALQLLQT